MPKATVYEYDRRPFPEHQVRLPWQIFHVQTEPKSQSVRRFSDKDLRFSVF